MKENERTYQQVLAEIKDLEQQLDHLHVEAEHLRPQTKFRSEWLWPFLGGPIALTFSYAGLLDMHKSNIENAGTTTLLAFTGAIGLALFIGGAWKFFTRN
jgi:hypothetical protein